MAASRTARLSPALLLSTALGAAVWPTGGCGGDEGEPTEPEVSGAFVVLAPAAREATVSDFLRTVPIEGVVVAGRKDPARELGRGGGAVRVALVEEAGCEGCYRIDGAQGRYTVRGGDVLGLQYGVAHLLEEMGVRFFHPWRTHVPATLASPDASPALGKAHQPEMTLRGLHLHTLHPIEAYYDFWEPGEASMEGARRTIDWLVKNRGNYVQWPALDSVTTGDEAAEAWRKHTRAIVDFAHGRGVKVGLGLQLFGTSSLQRSLTLLRNAGEEEPRQRMREQYMALLRDIPADKVNLSFGEFSGGNPDAFVTSVNLARDVLEEVAPEAEMDANIHVGNYPELRVNYQGENLLYYFLVKFADPRIVPSVHTVMYFNLFEHAGGAYLHDQFDEHRAYLIDRLRAQQRVIYKPESAYWVAFDNSVPTYLPVYVHTRHLDIARLRQEAGTPLREHLLFTSGWEWGYWQTDYATLRMNYALPDTPRALFDQMFAPWGEAGQRLAQAIDDAASAQHTYLLDKRLAAYLAGRDFLIDIGAKSGKIGAPDRLGFAAVAALPPAEQDAFEASVVEPLGALAAALDAAREQAAAASLPGAERFHAEVLDGLESTARRAAFVQAAYRAALAHGRKQNTAPHLAAMDAALAAAQVAVGRRHADLHSPLAERLYTDNKNATLYGYGYLREAHSLCFWRRERVEVDNLLTGADKQPPGCVL